MKRDCIWCRGTLSHRTNHLKSVMCPGAYAQRRDRNARWMRERRLDWVWNQDALLRDRARRVGKRIAGHV